MERAILEAVARADLILCWVWRVTRILGIIGIGLAISHFIKGAGRK